MTNDISSSSTTRKFYVYKHTNNSNQKVYIGITCQKPKVRWNNGNGYSYNNHFFRAIQSVGWGGFTHEILFENLSEQEALRIEEKLIEDYDATNPEKGYNHLKNSYSPPIISEKGREKIQEINHRKKGRTMQEITGNPEWANSKKGKTMQEITGNPEYISPSGWKKTPEQIQHNIDSKEKNGTLHKPSWNKGVPMSESTREKDRQTHLGKTPWNKGKSLKELKGEDYISPIKGKSGKEIFGHGNEDWVDPKKGRPNEVVKQKLSQRKLLFKEMQEEGTFTGTWNEFQTYCKIKNIFS